MKKYILGIIPVICSLLLSAQEYTISGTVTNEFGEPLAGANIEVKPTYLFEITDSAGKYTLPNLKEGEYTLVFSYLGCKTVSKTIQLTNNSIVHAQLPIAVFTSPLVITAIRAKKTMPFAQSEITQQEITRQNVAEDVPFVLSLTPSVVATSENGTGYGYTGMRIRGTDMTRINVTVNGVPLNDAESHGVFWVNMSDFTSSVDNVQIQRGVGTSTNGAASFGASVNFETEGPAHEKYVQLSSTVGSFNTFQRMISGGTGLLDSSFAFSARYSKLNSDGYVKRGFSDHESIHLSGAFFKKNHTLQANVLLGKEKTGITWEGISPDMLAIDRRYNQAGSYTDNEGNEQFYDNETDNYEQNHYVLNYSWDMTKHIDVTASLHTTTGKGYYEQYKEDEFLSDYDIEPIQLSDSLLVINNHSHIFPDSLVYKTDLVRQKWLDNVFYGYVWGLTYSKNKLDMSLGNSYNIYDGDHYGYVIWQKFNPEADSYQWYTNNGLKKDFNAFAKAQYALTSEVSAFADLQFRSINYALSGVDDNLKELDETYNWNFINPKLGLNYTIDNKNNLFLSYAVSNREPARSDLLDSRDNINLSHETLHDVEFGYQYSRAKYALAINLYTMYYKNQLVLTGKVNNVGAALKENVPESYRRGIELVAAARPHKEIEWNGNMTISENKIRNYIEYATNYDKNWQEQTIITERGTTDISYSPSVVATNAIRLYPDEHMSFGFVSKYVGDQYVDNTSSEERKLDAYMFHNLYVQYSFPVSHTRKFTIQFRVNNITDEQYENNAYAGNWYEQGTEKTWMVVFPQARINYMCKVTIDL
ncbi:MAG: TonB-dependent receptor [Bacteroidales bacterium]